MSLIRAEWEKMWQSVKRIERSVTVAPSNKKEATIILNEVKKIKEQIESVIGQME